MVAVALAIDHLVLVARDVDATLTFYSAVFGAAIVDLERWRSGVAEHPVLDFGTWKVNVHPLETSIAPRATNPRPGTVDLCLSWPDSIESAMWHLECCSVEIELGPINQPGARGPAQSVYFRDPDGNLLELISYSSRPEQGAAR